MSLRRCALASILILSLSLGFTLPASAQTRCVTLTTGSGYGPVTVNVPQWVDQLHFVVDWSGLQLRVYIDGTIWATAMYSDPNAYTPRSSPGYWSGSRQIEFWGIMFQYIRGWEIRGCGSVPPTPTPTPTLTPTPTRIPWPTSTGFYFICETSDPVPVFGLGTEYVAIGSSVRITMDEGASGDPDTVYEVINPGSSWGARYSQPMTFPLIGSALIRIVGGSGFGVPGVWVEVETCSAGIDLRATPLVPSELTPNSDDIRPVEAGATYISTSCYSIMPSVSINITIPGFDPIAFDYGGFGVCVDRFRLMLRWGSFDIIAIVVPLLSFAFLWAVYQIFRRG